jgi:phospholipase/carboxylesterase
MLLDRPALFAAGIGSSLVHASEWSLAPVAKIKYHTQRRQIGPLDCVVISSDQPPKALGVLCHGFGASGDDLVGLAPDLLHTRKSDTPVQLIFPAGLLSLDSEGYGDGRAWWNLSIQRLIGAIEQGHYELIREESPPGIDQARQCLVQTIELLLAQTGLSSRQLLLGGFSQGAMLAMEVACCGLPSPPAALALYSGCLIRELQWKPVAARLASTKIVQSHGTLDQILPVRTGLWLREMLVQNGCQVDFLQFQGPHTIPWDAIEHTGRLLDELAAAQSTGSRSGEGERA